MVAFTSKNQYWRGSQFVMRKARHLMDEENRRFLDTVIATSATRIGSIGKDAIVWRAQLEHDTVVEILRDTEQNEIDSFEIEVPCKPEPMKPWADRAHEGRVNPKGIPASMPQPTETPRWRRRAPGWDHSYPSDSL